MERRNHWIQPMLFALAGAALTLLGWWWRDGLGGSILVWVPSGVDVAALHFASRRNWPRTIIAIAAARLAAFTAMGVPIDLATGYTTGVVAQALIAAWGGRRILGGRAKRTRTFRHVVGIFSNTLLACFVGTVIVLPLRTEQGLAEFAWWFLANVIGILAVTPLVMQAKNWLAGSRRHIAIPQWRELSAAIAAFCALGAVALLFAPTMLAPMPVAGLVFLTIRFGHQSSAAAVFVFATLATALTIGGASPIAVPHLTVFESALAVQCWMMIMLATALPIAAMMLKREELQLELIGRNASMHENLMLLDLSEEMAGIGRWRLDLVTGEQDWSQRMLEMNGLPAELAPDPGDIRHLLPDNGRALLAQITQNRRARDPFTFDYRMKPPQGTERILRISVLNEFDMTGRRIALFGIAQDVTEQVHREQALDTARGRAVRLAAEAQKLANTDPLTSLPNRRCTFSRLASLIDLATKHRSPLTAIMFDIDHFKGINDSHGHQTGDEVIVQVAELARRQARQGDLVGRIGGEEFVWLLPGIDGRNARSLAERLRLSVERGIEGSSLPNVTISIGIATFARGDSGDALLARADTALYEAKEGGRNQVRRAA